MTLRGGNKNALKKVPTASSVEASLRDWQNRHNSTDSYQSTDTVKGPSGGRGTPVAVDTLKQYVISFFELLERNG